MKKYDVVISFSEEQKDIAVGISVALESIGISTYYYPYKAEENIGKDLKQNLYKVYNTDAVVAIAILSEKYFSSVFTMVELKAILNRLKTDSSYFIPIKFGTTELPNYLKHLTHVDWKSDIKGLLNTVKKRLENRVNLYLEATSEKISKLSKGTLLKTIERLSKFKNLENPEFHFRLALYYYHLNQSKNDLEQAIYHLQKVIIDKRSNHQALYWLSRITIEHKGINKITFRDIAEPASWLKEAIRLSPQEPNYIVLANLLNTRFYKKHGLRSPF